MLCTDHICFLFAFTDGYTTEDLIFLWKKVNPVQITHPLNLPRFKLIKYKTNYCTSKTNTGKLWLSFGRHQVQIHSIFPSRFFSFFVLYVHSLYRLTIDANSLKSSFDCLCMTLWSIWQILVFLLQSNFSLLPSFFRIEFDLIWFNLFSIQFNSIQSRTLQIPPAFPHALL